MTADRDRMKAEQAMMLRCVESSLDALAPMAIELFEAALAQGRSGEHDSV